jgi:transposase
MPLDFTIHFDEAIPDDDITRTVVNAVEDAGLIRFVNTSDRDSYGYDSMSMLQCVILAMTLFGYVSVRQLEDLCRYDTRFLFVTHGLKPSFMSFERFIKDDLTDPIEDIFHQLNRWIQDHDTDMNPDVLTIDGTKYEANANKMSFVWMKATEKFRTKCWVKDMKLLEQWNQCCREQEIDLQFSILHQIDLNYLMSICLSMEEHMERNKISFKHGKGKHKSEIQRYYDQFKTDAVKMWKYEMHHDIAGRRNSFSKTDPDASFMHMKYDYYNHTNVFKPGYNVQMGVSDGYIRHVYISADANDIPTYIPFMKGYYDAYGCYPDKTPADAGYGSYDNYCFCKLHGIKLFMKYSGQDKQRKKNNAKNKFKAWAFSKDDQGRRLCPNGYPFITVSTRIETRGLFPRVIEGQETGHCDGCPLRSKCTKSRKGRHLSITRQLEQFHEEVCFNMKTDEGHRLMLERSIQSEGNFGNLKENWQFNKLHRRGNSNVKTEILMVSIGTNLRRYHLRKYGTVSDSSVPAAA